MRIPDPIHEPQDWKGHRAVRGVVLHDDRASRDPLRFPQEHHRILGMVKYVDKHYGGEVLVVERKAIAIERLDRDPGFGPDEHIDTADHKPRHGRLNEEIDRSLATADIERGLHIKKQCGKSISKNSRTAG